MFISHKSYPISVSDTDDEDSSSAENEILTEPDSSSKSRRPSKKPPESLTGNDICSGFHGHRQSMP